MSYFPEDIPFMSKEELRENGIRIPKDTTDINVGDTISRQAAIDAIEKNACNTQRIMDAVNNLPSAQPESGRWIYTPGMNEQCSACGQYFPLSYFKDRPFDIKYCPHCGAYMRGEKDE